MLYISLEFVLSRITYLQVTFHSPVSSFLTHFPAPLEVEYHLLQFFQLRSQVSIHTPMLFSRPIHCCIHTAHTQTSYYIDRPHSYFKLDGDPSLATIHSFCSSASSLLALSMRMNSKTPLGAYWAGKLVVKTRGLKEICRVTLMLGCSTVQSELQSPVLRGSHFLILKWSNRQAGRCSERFRCYSVG